MLRQEAAAFDRRQVTVGLHQALEEKRNAGKRPVRPRPDAAGFGASLIEPAGDDRIEGRIQPLNAGDGGVADRGGAHLTAPDEIGETEGVMSVVVFGLHVRYRARNDPSSSWRESPHGSGVDRSRMSIPRQRRCVLAATPWPKVL